MKKTLIALAAFAIVGTASAQSTVTLFGVVDAAIAYGTGDLSSKSALANSGTNSSRLGFKGVEDLGGGLQAGFWLEAGVNNDDGSGGATNNNNQARPVTDPAINARNQGLTFNRRSTISVMGNFGEVRLGRDYTPQFWSETAYDPFGTNGVGTNRAFNQGGQVGIRASNSVAYLSPKMGGFAAWAQVYMGENQSTAAAQVGNGAALRVTYDQGPISLAVAFASTTIGAGSDQKSTNIGGSYDLKVAQIQAFVSKQQITGAHDIDGYLIGTTVPVGPGTVKASYSTNDTGAGKTNQFAVGYVYDLSKRTALYGTFATVSNSEGASAALNGSSTSVNGSSKGVDMGVRHSF